MIFSVRRLSDVSEQELTDAFFQADDWRKEQIRRLKLPIAKKQCLMGDALARELLSKLCPGCTLHFSRDVNGKPHLLGGDVHFNISHSGEHVLCAVDETPVGVDIEEFRPVREDLIRKVCTESELEWIAGSGERFLQIWTAKEAYLKYLGVGLKMPLREVSVITQNGLQIEGLELFSELTDCYAMSIVYEKRHP